MLYHIYYLTGYVFFLKNLFCLQLKMILSLKIENFCENKYAVNQDVFCCYFRHLPYSKNIIASRTGNGIHATNLKACCCV